MGRCRKCKGTKIQRDDPPFENFVSRCMECNGSGTDEKPQCPKHKISHKYSGAIGWYCPTCDDSRMMGWWENVYSPE